MHVPNIEPRSVPSAPVFDSTSPAVAGDTQVILKWNELDTDAETGGASVSSYKLSTNGGTTYTTISGWTLQLMGGKLLMTVTSLTNGTSYTFKLKAVNTHGDGFESAGTSATPSGPPLVPTGLLVTRRDTTTTGGKLRFAWTAPNDNGATITGYSYRYKVASAGSSSWSTATTSATSVDVSGLTNGTTYHFQVQATNTSGTGSFSSSSSSLAPQARPQSSPSFETGTVAGVGQVTLIWNHFTDAADTGGSPITGYVVDQNGS